MIFSDHALIQMKERHLQKMEIMTAVKEPKKMILQSHHRFRATGMTLRNGKWYALIVIYESIDNCKIVVTAFLSSKPNKYL